jgi:quercetin dioxygenase-like cupin family protein
MKFAKILPAVLVVLLFACQVQGKENQSATVKELVKSNLSWDGSPLPAYPAGKPEISILRITIPPGTQLPMHRHPIINAGVLIGGELTVVTKDDKTLHLQAGDPIVEVVDTWHYGKNEGTQPADIIVFYAGTSGAPLSIKENQ